MEQLEELRQKILGTVAPLIIDSADTGSDKFSLILRLIQSGNGDQGMYNKAYESAVAIEDSGERLDALMALLNEIEVDIDRYADRDEALDEPSEVSAQVPAPEQSSEQEHYENQ
jgi:hypothetical protein